MRWTCLLFMLASVAAACRNQDEAGAEALWAELQDADYRGWARAPGFPGLEPSATAHGDQVEIFINDTVVEALTRTGLKTWPEGSLIVKDGFKAGKPYIVAAMERREDGWFWAEWDPNGKVLFSGEPRVCTKCHASGDDAVRAFPLP